MTDCYPLQTGGIRAWAKVDTRSRAGIPSTHFPLAIYARNGISVRSGAPTGNSDYYLMTAVSADKQARLWRWDDTDDVTPPTAWTLLKTFAASTSAFPGFSIFQTFTPNSGPFDDITSVYLSFGWVASTDQGVWRIAYSDGAMSRIASYATYGEPHIFLVHQDRLLFGSTQANGARLWFSDPATEDFPVANFLDVAPDQPNSLNVFGKSWFGELLLGKRSAPMYLIQGDITDPTSRTLSDAVPPVGQQLVTEIPEGVVYCAFDAGYFITESGVRVEPLSSQIRPDLIAGPAGVRTGLDVTLGNTSYIHPFLVTPSGHIYDTRTKAWFRTSEFGPGMTRPRAKHSFYVSDPDDPKLILTTDEVDFDILEISANESRMKRRRSYTYRSPPMRRSDGRRIGIREVLLPINAHRTGSSCQVTINGVTREIANIVAGKQILRFPFDTEHEYLEVKIVPDSGDDAYEAPTLEVGRVGTQPGHLLAAETVTTV